VTLALTVAYPALVYFALRWFEPRAVALALLLVLGARAAFAARAGALASLRAVAAPLGAVAAVLAASALWNDLASLRLTPALISFALLGSFGLSLASGDESVVERIARAQRGVLPPEETRYCRRVTWLWCGFFLLNGAVALGLALAASTPVWALYTGFVSYLLIGLLFASEYAYRQWRFRNYFGAPADLLFRRLFPPRAE
jgi:uncharacterized membrane protein